MTWKRTHGRGLALGPAAESPARRRALDLGLSSRSESARQGGGGAAPAGREEGGRAAAHAQTWGRWGSSRPPCTGSGRATAPRAGSGAGREAAARSPWGGKGPRWTGSRRKGLPPGAAAKSEHPGKPGRAPTDPYRKAAKSRTRTPSSAPRAAVPIPPHAGRPPAADVAPPGRPPAQWLSPGLSAAWRAPRGHSQGTSPSFPEAHQL